MRVIPKKTNVKMEFFKGIGVIDVLVILVGGALTLGCMMANFPGHFIISAIFLVLTITIVVPIDEDKGYELIFCLVKYIARPKVFGVPEEDEQVPQGKMTKILSEFIDILPKFGKKSNAKKKENPSVESITPFTGINGKFIEYGRSYYGVVMEIPSLEFRLYSESRQNSMIDRSFAGLLRELRIEQTAELVKVDRPIIYDSYIETEQSKKKDIKEAYLNGLLTDEELTCRIGIIEDRISMIQRFNTKEKVYVGFHYLLFFGNDRELLNSQVHDAITAFSGADMQVHQLEGPELAIFLKYNYTVDFDEREAYKLQPDQYLNWILPKSIVFTPRTVRYDSLITHNLKVRRYPTLVYNAWGYRLFNMPGTRTVMKIKPMDRYKSTQQIDRAINELQSQGMNTGRASKQMEVGEHIDTLAEVLRLLQGDNETLFSTDTYVTIYDYEYTNALKEYNRKRLLGEKNLRVPQIKQKRKIRAQMSEGGFRSSDMLMQQYEVYCSAQISANDMLRNDATSIHSSSVAAAFPFVVKHMMDERGVFIGESNGVPAFIDLFKRDKDRVNSNMVIIGKSGSGKSYATKTILTHLAAENSKIFILDPENEYQKMAENFNGKIIDVGTASQGRLNPFHIITSLSDDDNVEGDDDEGSAVNSLNVHLQFLEEFYRQILPGIDADALEFLNNITIRMYEEKGITTDTDLSQLEPADYPTFDDLYEQTLSDFQTTNGEYSKRNLRVLLNYLSKFATGGRNSSLWNGEATISTNENFIVFNFQSLLANKNNMIANAQMLLVLKWLDNEIIKNRDYNIRYGENRKIIIVIDEAHVFIDDKYPIALDFMFQLAKRIRKYNGMQVVITQNVRDFVGTEELARKSTAIINASQYSFIFPLAPNDMHDLCKLYEKAGAINESEQEDIINNGRGRAFLITTPTERCNVDIIAGTDIENLFTL